MQIPVYNQQGTEVDKLKLKAEIFNIKIKPWVIQETVRAQLANARIPIAHTKDRSEVRGGGKKPWKQKGTGRARHGSIRSPLWKGGGVTFGPRNIRNFSIKINKKIKRQALLMSLTEKAQGENIKVLDTLNFSEVKTKYIVQLLKKLEIDNKTVLLALDKAADDVLKSARNISNIKLIAPNSLNTVDMLNSDIFLTTLNGIKIIEKTYGTSR